MPKEMLIVAAVLAIGIALGIIFDRVLTHHHVGTFTINYEDPETDLCTLRLDKDLGQIQKLRTMELDIKVIGKEHYYGTDSERDTEQHQ